MTETQDEPTAEKAAADAPSNDASTVKPEKKSAITSGKEFIGNVLKDPAVQTVVTGFVTSEAAKHLKKPGIGYTILGFAATRIAKRSLPGAMVIGAGIAAKSLYDYRKKKKAEDAADGTVKALPDATDADSATGDA
ncbi:hypothetical protein [Alterisphingorhabdus coralli]|uniref:Uncharacterized protein n=1 Tax=Alterisphingorhabdus coralli TaxID=3071408 RepID=A0AA97F507_9SPHN|nr:hypothetical protein [Parasphingorhabdus sp. SCSIO 66989]WOE74444.1 hypothetical protein RB602_11375 [Parasphingorhabdus sp. SCSIO 66989]